MLEIPDLIKYLKGGKRKPAEDMIDRLNAHITVWILFAFVAITGSKLTFGSLIKCMTPAESAGSWSRYYHDYCYIQDKVTLRLPIEGLEEDPLNLQDKGTQIITYYQWVPYILIAQAVLFMLPSFCWNIVVSNICNGRDLETVVDEAVTIESLPPEKYKRALEKLAKLITVSFKLRTNQPLTGRSITVCYVIRKWLAFINVAVQFILLCYIIPHDFNLFWGLQIMGNKWGKDDMDMVQSFFPTLVRCDVDRMELKNVHRISLQCVITMNFINEKIFVIVYFWLLMMFIVNLLSALRWTVFLISQDNRDALLDSLIPVEDVLFASAINVHGAQVNRMHHKTLLDYFTYSILKTDGILLLRFVFSHAGGVLTYDLSHELWKLCIQPTFSISDYEELDDYRKDDEQRLLYNH